MPPRFSAPVRFHAKSPFPRRREPVCLGLPWPKGAVANEAQFRLAGPPGADETLQSRVLDRWSDGSIRWCLFDFLANHTSESDYRIEVIDEPRREPPGCGPAILTCDFNNDGIVLDTQTTGRVQAAVILELDPGGQTPIRLRSRSVERGPIRTSVDFESATRLPDGLELFGRLDLYQDHPVARIRLTLRNTNPSAHPGGTWDLGNAGSVSIREFSFTLRSVDAGGSHSTRCSHTPETALEQFDGPLNLVQASSGGKNWNCHNHLDRDHRVSLEFRGYRLETQSGAFEGLRSTPVVTWENGTRFIGLAMPRFWENFPKAIQSDESGLTLGLFPRRPGTMHELLGGEQKTHEFYVALGEDGITDLPMDWCRSPLLAHSDPEWYAASGAVPYLTPARDDRNVAYRELVNLAIEGSDTFFTKREAIDEYGWRNFGDVYADHEAAFHEGSEPLVSHYNNQFDVVNGCAVQFLRSADPRWWELLIPAADHTCDIDIYHTTHDKNAYNGGLFPFTFHYADADTSAHRGYPSALQRLDRAGFGRNLDALGTTGAELKRAIDRGIGGGPSASHVYNAGLMLAYFLTGNPVYRDEAIGQAEFVIRMDEPRALFRLLSGEYSGEATPSGSPDYHGPGRASANSILALLVGHQLTGRREFLDKAEQIISRVSHPRQDLDRLDLLNAELRWFYVMHVQALGAYLDYKAAIGERDRPYARARLTLLHYARWMADHERPFLSDANELQYRTETWPAQDMRKVEAFQFAAKHASGDEKRRFLERAEWFFRYVEETLSSFPTRSFCRPVNLMMNFGFSRSWWQANPHAEAPGPIEEATAGEFGTWKMFVSQKRRVVRRLKLLVATGTALLLFLGGLLICSG